MIENLKKELKEEKKIIFGSKQSIKYLKKNKTKKVFISYNCPENIKKEIKELAKLNKIEVIEIKKTKEELAEICKKPFNISTISILK